MRQSAVFILILVIVLILGACGKRPEDQRAGYLKNAAQYSSQQKYAEAAIEYQNALKIAPDDVDSLINLGNTELRLRRVKEAYRAFLKASQIDPKNIRALTNLAALYLFVKDYEKARQCTQTILAIDTNNLKAREIQAQAMYLSGKRLEGLSLMENVLAQGQPSESTMVNAVQMYVGLDKGEQALSLIQKGIAHYPASSRLRIEASAVYAAQNNLTLARQWADEAYNVSAKGIEDGLTLANFYLNHGFSASLEALLKDLTARFPRDPRPVMLQAEASRKKGDIKTALVLAQKAQSLGETPAGARLVAELLIAQGDQAGAMDVLEKTLTQHPEAMSARLLLSSLTLAQGEADKTLAIIDPVLKHSPTNPDVAMVAAKAYLLKGEMDNARQAIETALTANPQDANLHAVMARIAITKGGYKDTITEAAMALKATPTSIDILSMAAIAAIRLGKLDQGLTYIESLRKAHPDTWATIYCETLYYAAKGDKENTLNTVQHGLKLWPDKPEALSLYANVAPQVIGLTGAIDEIMHLCAAGKSAQCRLTLAGMLEAADRKDKALVAIKQAIDLDPKRYEIYHYLASFYIRNHMTEAALKEYEGLLNKKPNDLKAATLLALIHHDAGHIERAAKLYNDILVRDPANGIAANNLAWIIADTGQRPDLDRAMQLASKAKERYPDNPRIADTLGYVYLKKGLYANAQTQFVYALERTPDDPLINYHMGLTLARQGRNKDAIPYVKKALSTKETFKARAAAQKLMADLSTAKK